MSNPLFKTNYGTSYTHASQGANKDIKDWKTTSETLKKVIENGASIWDFMTETDVGGQTGLVLNIAKLTEYSKKDDDEIKKAISNAQKEYNSDSYTYSGKSLIEYFKDLNLSGSDLTTAIKSFLKYKTTK